MIKILLSHLSIVQRYTLTNMAIRKSEMDVNFDIDLCHIDRCVSKILIMLFNISGYSGLYVIQYFYITTQLRFLCNNKN
jgi:hypothetical protein